MGKVRNLGFIAAVAVVAVVILVAFLSNSPPSQTGVEINVCMHIESRNESTVADLAELGVNWVRVDWVPSEMEGFMRDTEASWVNVLAIIDSDTFNGSIPSMAVWNDTVKSILQSPGADLVDAWEIWNEPNGDGDAYLEPILYAEMLRSAYSLINVFTSVPVVAAGLAPNDSWSYFDAVYSYEGISSWFNVLGVHLYNGTSENLAFLEEVGKRTEKPIWVTEVGRPSGDDPYSEADQAIYVRENYAVLASKVGRVFWYQLYDENIDYVDSDLEKENYFGLITLDGTRKPAFYVLRDFGKLQ